MRIRLVSALLAAGALALAGCGDRSGMPLGVVVGSGPGGGSGGALSVEVSDTTGTTTPVYDWTGDGARELVVVRLSDGLPMWRLEASDPDAGFGAPVRHGVTPPGARQTTGSTLLSPDVQYSVEVVSVDGVRGSTVYTP